MMEIAGPTFAFLKAKGAWIEDVPAPGKFGDTVHFMGDPPTLKGRPVVLDCHLHYTWVGDCPPLADTFRQMFYESIRARVQATLVPPEHCVERIATLDTVEANGNSIKVRMVRNRIPLGSVYKLGGQVYGVVCVHELKSRHRLILDRPVVGQFSRGTQIEGCGVASNPPFNSFKGVTVVSVKTIGDENTQYDTHGGLHFALHQQPEGNKTRYVIETLFGLHVDPSHASLR